MARANGVLQKTSSTYKLSNAQAEFEVKLDEEHGIKWKLIDREQCSRASIYGFGLPTVVLSAAHGSARLTAAADTVRVERQDITVPALSDDEGGRDHTSDAMVIRAHTEKLGDTLVEYALSGRKLLQRVHFPSVQAPEVQPSEFLLWHGEVVLGDGSKGYDDLDSGVLVDGMLSVRMAAALLALVAAVYAGIARVIPEYTTLLVGHFLLVVLGTAVAVRGLRGGLISGPRSMFVNSWQSWGFCGSVRMGKRMPLPALYHYFTRGFHLGAHPDLLPPYSRTRGIDKQYFSDMFTALVDLRVRCGVVMGFLSQKMHFGGMYFDRTMRRGVVRCQCDDQYVKRGRALSTDWMLYQLLPQLPEEALREYCEAVARSNPPHFGRFGETPIGWCSWYYYKEHVTARDLYANLENLSANKDKMPVQIFQLDDGYQSHWGDWLKPKKSFPEDMREVALRIAEHGFTPGIWIAPFSADFRSRYRKDHPERVLMNARGRIANSGNCAKFFCGLDVTNAQVMADVRRNLQTITTEWGFKYVKIDFLYSGVLGDNSRRMDRSKTRAEAFYEAIKAVRESVGEDVFLVGCGCPLGTAVGYVNAMRIGSDVDKMWYPLVFWDKWNLPGARNGVRNTMTRSMFHRRWWVNDPDCVLFRDNTSFSDAEVYGIATVIAMGGGMFMISDEMQWVRDERRRIAASLNPPTSRAAVPLDLFENEEPTELLLRLRNAVSGDEWALLALCNWENRTKVKGFDLCRLGFEAKTVLHVMEFWERKYVNMTAEKRLKVRLQPHSARLYAIRAVRARESNSVQYIGSDMHFSCGLELTALERLGSSPSSFRLFLGVQRHTDAHVWVQLPFDGAPRLSGNAVRSDRPAKRAHESGVWKIPVHLVERGSELIITEAPQR